MSHIGPIGGGTLSGKGEAPRVRDESHNFQGRSYPLLTHLTYTYLENMSDMYFLPTYLCIFVLANVILDDPV